ncbi:cysteine proteinase [Auricularia subglabra TFB-10046 SS5]|nr:cysteine proteinase [Auricularia subglabra TFB-10046 SS5]
MPPRKKAAPRGKAAAAAKKAAAEAEAAAAAAAKEPTPPPPPPPREPSAPPPPPEPEREPSPPPKKRQRLEEPVPAPAPGPSFASAPEIDVSPEQAERDALAAALLAEEDEALDDAAAKGGATRPSDLYLDTVNRNALDFDFEKLCSVCLSNIHIYGCLVCGKYFQGRGKSSYAYAHSVHEDHHVFINLETGKVYVLPDGYLVSDPSLDDIGHVLNPRFTPQSIKYLSSPVHLQTPSYDLSRKPYIPGFVGLNNIKRNDHLNVVIHALLHVAPLRDFLLLSQFDGGKQPELVKRFAALAKKLWNPRLFKAQVSPHEFLQEVVRVSQGRFRITELGDPAEFLGWLLNRLHIDMGGSKKRNSSIIYRTFQGELRLETQQVKVNKDLFGVARPQFDIDRDIKKTTTPFLWLALDLPAPPLFQDGEDKNIVPQVTLASVLAKYDGNTTQENAGQLKRYKLTALPPYIVLHYKRFTKNNFVEEKNPTIVNFPLRGVDFAEYLDAAGGPQAYDLLANITHESVAGTTRDKESTVWKVHLRAGGGGGDGEKWFLIQDLLLEETRKDMIFLGETVLQIWERRADAAAGVSAGRGEAANGSSGSSSKMDVDL